MKGKRVKRKIETEAVGVGSRIVQNAGISVLYLREVALKGTR